jgi:protein-disulfide isomerase
MNYRIFGFYIFIIGFFGFLAFAYLNYEAEKKDRIVGKAIDKDAIKEQVIAVINEHPEVIIDTINRHYAAQQEKLLKSQAASLVSYKDKLESDDSDPKVGNPEAPVKIVVFFDYLCGYCKRMQPIEEKLLQENSNIQIIFKELPILGANSMIAAKTALAVHMLDAAKYHPLHELFMQEKTQLTEDRLRELVGSLGLDYKLVAEKRNDPEITKILDSNRKIATEILVQGTPSYVINGKISENVSTYEAFQAAINKAAQN